MSGSTLYRTPRPEFEALNREFHFNVDAAAGPFDGADGPTNSLVSARPCVVCYRAHGRYYTAETDGTKREHYGAGDVVWANPPYSPGALVDAYFDTAAWTSQNVGALWVLLVNSMMTSTRRWHDHVWDRELHRFRDRVEVRYPDHRINFIRPDGKPSANRHDSMVVIFRPRLEASK